jgi:hypothetical protein
MFAYEILRLTSPFSLQNGVVHHDTPSQGVCQTIHELSRNIAQRVLPVHMGKIKMTALRFPR